MVSPWANSRAGPLAKRFAVSIWPASKTGNIWSRRLSTRLIVFPWHSPKFRRQSTDHRNGDVGTGADFRQRLHIAQRLGKNIARTGEAAFIALGNWRTAEADRYRGPF